MHVKNILTKIKKTIKNNIFMLSYIHQSCPYHIILTLFVSVLGSFSAIINLLITRYIINIIQVGNGEDLFYSVSIMILMLFIIDLLYLSISTYIQQVVIPRNTQIISQQMQKELFNKAAVIELKFYDDPSFYNIFCLALQQTDIRAQEVLRTFSTSLSSLFSISALCTLMFIMEPILIILVMINVLVAFFINVYAAKLQHFYSKEKVQPQREIEYAKYVFYKAENAKELRLSGSIKTLLTDKLFTASNSIIDLINRYGKKLTTYSRIQSAMNKTISTLVMIYLAYKVINRKLLIGDFSALSTSSQQLSAQIMGLINIFPQMYEHSLYIENFKEFLEIPVVNYNKGIGIDKINSIKLDNVSFTYPLNDSETLKNINLELVMNQKIAIVGENGAGKSTLVKLLTGLYETNEGKIIINGNNINTYKMDDYRKCIGVVFQDFKIYALSIAENILMRKIHNKELDEKLVINALRFADLYEKVMRLPEGIYTKVTREFEDDGVMFSGGEMQRIMLARVYISKCSMLILDEPSSSLDPISESGMMNKMMDMSQNKCVIIISHRLRNIKNVDHIYVMNKGKIIEHGSHKELMEKKGMYFTMYNKQNR